MSNPVWPPSLPQTFFIGVRDKRRPAVARFTADNGTVSVRKISASASRDISAPIPVLTNAQRIALDEFFIDVLDEGSLPFDWIDPVTRLACTYLISEPPGYSQSLKSDGDLFETTLLLERLS